MRRWGGKTMKAASQTEINHPAHRIDLGAWLSTLSDRDYQACSHSHRAAGTFREAGTFGMVNVESVGGHLLVQHYLAVTSTPSHVVMHSKATRVYVMHLAPAIIEVIWTLKVEPRDDQNAVLHCSVETCMPAPLAFIATLALLPLFLRRHVQEETPGFARDIARKVSEGPLMEISSVSNRTLG
jgi:hypothetical protein